MDDCEENFGPPLVLFSSIFLITSLYARDNKPPTIIAAIVLVHETSGNPSSPG